ncbi:MAG: serine--tRNA ligase [Magnetococcales bacterium]|nr:serine--tRNA ligase [Magnetococcales bacterium]NGZ26157.1 serine--tRNA ligase [Magnetococcales bacterium]
MLDIRLIRSRPEWVEERLASRGKGHSLTAFRELESRKRSVQTETEGLQARRNAMSKEIGQRKGRGEETDSLLSEMAGIGPRLKELEGQLRELEEEVNRLLAELPNLPHESVPVGEDENSNIEIHRWPPGGDPAPLPFAARAHWDVGEALGILDFQSAARIAGARFSVLRGAGARLSRALINFMLDLHTTEHGYTEVLPPFLVNGDALFGTGQLPKFEEELFKTRDDAYYLIPTAEVPVTNLVRESILEESALPMKMVAWTACFRREAGSSGKDTRGLIRQHQFDKVELVHITRPQDSYQALEELTSHAEEVLRRLELPFRRIVLCTGDMGFGSTKTYDLEVWLPGQGRYREISSCSNTEAFQALRMKARYRDSESGKNFPVHTLNGSGVAVGRTLVAILENFQQADGSVVIPDALRPFMNGLAVIGGNKS